MLTVQVKTDDFNKDGEGKLEQTEMFVPSTSEWELVPAEIRVKISAGTGVGSRSFGGSGVGNYNVTSCCRVAPAFYLSDNLLKSSLEEQESKINVEKKEKTDDMGNPAYRPKFTDDTCNCLLISVYLQKK